MKRFKIRYKQLALIVAISILVTTAAFYYFNQEKQPLPTSQPTKTKLKEQSPNQSNEVKNFKYRIFIIGDTHLNSQAFSSLEVKISEYKPTLIIHLGDHTDYGDLKSLDEAKKLLDNLRTEYIVLPGDRDLAASQGKENFKKFFKEQKYVKLGQVNLLFLDNSFNFTPLNEKEYFEYIEYVKKSNIILASQPLLTNPREIFSEKYMGSLENPENNERHMSNLLSYNNQKNQILEIIRISDIKYVIAADHHISSIYEDPVKQGLIHHNVGALANYIQLGELKIKQEALQNKRFSILMFNDLNDIEVTEVPLED